MVAGLWKAFVFVVALAVVFSGAHRPQNYDNIAAQALKFYNNGQQGKPLFRLLQATPPSGRNSNSKIPLNFRMKRQYALPHQKDSLKTEPFGRMGLSRGVRREACQYRVAQVSSFADYPVADVPKEDDPAELPPASNDIISNIPGEYLGLEEGEEVLPVPHDLPLPTSLHYLQHLLS